MCLVCGEVLDESTLINEVGFSQGADGRSSVIGRRVAGASLVGSKDNLGGFWSQSGAPVVGASALGSTLHHGGMRIEWITGQLGMRAGIIDESKRLFQLAAHRNFTAGRKTSHVAAACVYTVCRRDSEPFLLLDFADILRTTVRALGQIYMKLVRLLNLDKILVLPVIDPSLFLERFAARLPLDEAGLQSVPHTAARIIQAMSRHWIVTGRRPNGLCGAALLISCRFHGYDEVDASSLSSVVRIGEHTIKRRLYELRDTPAGMLTADSLAAIEGPKAGGPDAEQLGSAAHSQLGSAVQSLVVPSDGNDSSTSLPPCMLRQRKAQMKAIQEAQSDSDSEDEISSRLPALTSCVINVEDACAEEPSASQISEVASLVLSHLRLKADSQSESEQEFLRLMGSLDSQGNLGTADDEVDIPVAAFFEPKAEDESPKQKTTTKKGKKTTARSSKSAGASSKSASFLSDMSDVDIDDEILSPEESAVKAELWYQWSAPWLEDWEIRHSKPSTSALQSSAAFAGDGLLEGDIVADGLPSLGASQQAAAESSGQRAAVKRSTKPPEFKSAIESTMFAINKKARSLKKVIPGERLEQLFTPSGSG